jgi:hypothetical protein
VWESTADSTFSVYEDEGEALGRGTKIVLTLKVRACTRGALDTHICIHICMVYACGGHGRRRRAGGVGAGRGAAHAPHRAHRTYAVCRVRVYTPQCWARVNRGLVVAALAT